MYTQREVLISVSRLTLKKYLIEDNNNHTFKSSLQYVRAAHINKQEKNGLGVTQTLHRRILQKLQRNILLKKNLIFPR